MATLSLPKVIPGGSFLIENAAPEDIFTPEDFSEEQQEIARTTAEFAEKSILPRIPEIEAKNFSVTRELLLEAGKLGLMAVDVPEEYGGLALDKVTSALVSDRIAVSASFSVSFSAHTGIGTLPVIWYGTPAQKEKYLPRLASGEWIAAYALSESSSGSDAMNVRTQQRDLSMLVRHHIDGRERAVAPCGRRAPGRPRPTRHPSVTAGVPAAGDPDW
jgi:butyryl-CoA dehydrogenase